MKTRRPRRWRPSIVAAGILSGLVLVSPVPAEAFDLNKPARGFEEERMAAESQHAQIVRQFGGEVENTALADYVTGVGNRVVAASEMPDKPFTFTVLDSPIVNAFTVGGGYVYVTRGILASVNSEAELAALLGHEIGHVTARHTARRETRMEQDRAASIGVGLLTGSFTAAVVTNILGKVGQQAYSRDQEADSDVLGVESITKAGYDPYAMSDMLGALEREVALMTAMSSDGVGLPDWLQDHPQTDERRRDTLALAEKTGMAPGTGEVNRDAHLDAIEGVMFGTDPSGGILRDGKFQHPGLAISFDIPPSYQLLNQQGVLIGIRDSKSLFLFSGAQWPRERSLEDFARTAWFGLTEGDEGELDSVETTEINGLDAVITTKKIERLFLKATLVTVAYRVNDRTVLGLTFAVAGKLTQPQFDDFKAIAESFTPLSYADVKDIKPYILRSVEVTDGDTAETLSARMAQKDFKLERFIALNGIDGPLVPGFRVKIIVEE